MVEEMPCAAQPLCLPIPCNDAARLTEQYRIHKHLYKGSISSVFEAVDLCSGAHVVLKVYKKHSMDQGDRNQLEREMTIHGSLKHEHIIELITVVEDDQAVCLVQSFAQGGDLFSALHAAGRFDESRTAGTVIAPLLWALDYIHAKGIIHRDIKTENILLDAGGTLKLADFGLAIDSSSARPGTRVGTWEYMAPEIHQCPFKGDETYSSGAEATYSSSVDCWAVGILAYELLVGKPPFQLRGAKLSYEDIMTGDLVFPDGLSPDACSFIRSALCKKGRLRPSAGQLVKHRWLRPFVKEGLVDSAPSSPRHSRPRPEEPGTSRQRPTWACSSSCDRPRAASMHAARGTRTQPLSPLACSAGAAQDAPMQPVPPAGSAPGRPPASLAAARLARHAGPQRIQSLSDLDAAAARGLAGCGAGKQQQGSRSSLASAQPSGLLWHGASQHPGPGAAAVGRAPGDGSGHWTSSAADCKAAAGESVHSPFKRTQSRGDASGQDPAAQRVGPASSPLGLRQGSGSSDLGPSGLDEIMATMLHLPRIKGATAAGRGPPAGAMAHAPHGVRMAALRASSCPDLQHRLGACLGPARATVDCGEAAQVPQWSGDHGGMAMAVQPRSSPAPPAGPAASASAREPWADGDAICGPTKGPRLSRLASQSVQLLR